MRRLVTTVLAGSPHTVPNLNSWLGSARCQTPRRRSRGSAAVGALSLSSFCARQTSRRRLQLPPDSPPGHCRLEMSPPQPATADLTAAALASPGAAADSPAAAAALACRHPRLPPPPLAATTPPPSGSGALTGAGTLASRRRLRACRRGLSCHRRLCACRRGPLSVPPRPFSFIRRRMCVFDCTEALRDSRSRIGFARIGKSYRKIV